MRPVEATGVQDGLDTRWTLSATAYRSFHFCASPALRLRPFAANAHQAIAA
jgi:hypothetical protein